MEVAITGASGLVGSALVGRLEALGHRVRRLSRRKDAPGYEHWDPEAGHLDPRSLEGAQVLVHLAGENIGQGRWTAKKKDRILRSRVDGTRLVSSTWAQLPHPESRTLIASSAIGYYGSRGDELLTEESPPGDGFLAEVCKAWEAQTEVASRAGVRVVVLRTGVVLSRRGGALAAMLPVFRSGAGGRIGDGRQWVSWIALQDLVDVILAAASDGRYRGPVNAVSPHPVTNAEFTRALGRALHRPTLLPVPAFAIRTALGEMADEMLLASTRCVPKRLQELGFAFRFPDLDAALAAALT